MELYLNAGFGELLGKELLQQIQDIGFDGIRQDIPLENFSQLVDEVGTTPLDVIFLFGGDNMSGWTSQGFIDRVSLVARQITDEGYFTASKVYFEIGNEPDIAVDHWKQNPAKLNDTYWECYQAAKSINNKIEVVTPGISNLNQRGLDWLDDFMKDPIPAEAIVGYHRYPVGSDVTEPHDGFQSRMHEMNRLKSLAGGRQLLCTEAGLSQGPHKENKPFPLCWLQDEYYITEKEQSDGFLQEYSYCEVNKVEGLVWYQHRDGFNHNQILDNYGVLRNDHTEKYICEVIRGR